MIKKNFKVNKLLNKFIYFIKINLINYNFI